MKIGFVGANDVTKQYYNVIAAYGGDHQYCFIEPSLINARAFIKKYPITYFESDMDFLKSVDAVLICSFGKNNDELANKAVRMGRHILLAHPFVVSIGVVKQLQNLSKEAGVVIQNAWSEKYNPAYLTSSEYIDNAVFIDVARLSQYTPANSKISVINDLLFKDIEWVLGVVKSNIRKISANALSVVNNEPDFINAKLEFDNGCIANLTASRVSELNLRKARIYNDKSVLFTDFLDKQVKRSFKKSNLLEFEDIELNLSQESENQINDFISCIESGKEPKSGLQDILDSKETSMAIQEKIKVKTNLFVS